LDIWLALSGVVGGLSIGLIAVAVRRLPRTPMRPVLYAFVASGVLWSIGDLIASAATSAGWKHAGLAVLYTGAITLPALWWWVALRWADDVEAGLPLRHRLWRWGPLLWAGAMWTVMLTNPWHGAFITPVIGGHNVYQPAWYAMALPNYGLILASLAVELEVARRVARSEVRRQAAFMIAASGVTLLSNALYVSRVVELNATTVTLSVSTALLLVGMAREGLFGVLPAALSAIAAGHPDGLVVVGPDGRVRYANRRAHELLAPFGLGPKVGILDAFRSAERVAEVEDGEQLWSDVRWWKRLVTARGVTLRLADQSRWLHLTATPVHGRWLGERGHCLRIADATARKRAELAAAQTRRLESVTSLARTVSHDFQGVFAVVRANAELLESAARTPSAQRMLSRIVEAATTGAGMAQDLQLHTGTVDVARRELDLGEIVDEICGMGEDELPEGVALAHARSRRPLPVEADPIQLRQCVFNLLVNALEAAADAGGEVRIETGVRRMDPSRVASLVSGRDAPPGDFAYVEIRDDGGGMSSETEERAFEPFYSTRGKGRGNGLSAVLGIARAHAAPVSLVNEPGRGCTFTLYFPLAVR
jgi:signal transduction histidine kinase